VLEQNGPYASADDLNKKMKEKLNAAQMEVFNKYASKLVALKPAPEVCVNLNALLVLRRALHVPISADR
jgi:hypothetical protein